MDIEEQLRSALKREQPPAGFTQRVIDATRRGHAPRLSRQAWAPVVHSHWRAAAAVLMLTVLAGAWSARQIAERREGERARDEVVFALHIAGAKVRYAQTQVHEIGSKHVKESR
jgi:hypothetical protein